MTSHKYRAFLSYSHADASAAKRLHERLERFRIDKDLVGRNTAAGPIPGSLRPIFRDRHEFDAGGSLAEQTSAALDESAALILLASPRSARSKYVNEELRLFKSRHPDRPVIPLIVDGEPGHPRDECFPPALRFVVAAEGAITDAPTEVLAADMREKGDGFDLALAKIVARLIGLAPDDVYRRAERERRRQGRIRSAIVAMIGVLAIVGGGFYWRSRQQAETLAEISALVDKYSLVGSAEAAPGAKGSLTEAITAIANGAATDPRYAKALELLKAGKASEAEPLLKDVAEDKARRAGKDAADAADAYRNLASIAAVSDPGRARDYYAQAARLDPSNVYGMFRNAWFQGLAGQLDAAQAAYGAVLSAAKPGGDDHLTIWANFGIGDVYQERGKLSDALTSFRAGRAIAERLQKSDPGDAAWQRDLAISDEKIGLVLAAQGNLAEALKSYRDALAIRDRLGNSDPSKTEWQEYLVGSYEKIGDVLVAQGNLAEALKNFHDARAIDERLAKSDPGNVVWQRDLSVSANRVGGVLVAQGRLQEALETYRDGLALADRVVKSDPGNAEWQGELSGSYDTVGDVLVKLGNLPEALQSYRDGLAIADRLAKADPGKINWQRYLAVSYDRIGNVLSREGNLSEALKSYRDGLALADRLAKSAPGDAGRQRDLSVCDLKIGNVLVAQGDLPEALKNYRDGLAIAERLAKTDPGNVDWQRNVSLFEVKVGDVLITQGNVPEAVKSYRDGLAIVDRLARIDPGNVDWQRDVISACVKLAELDKPEARTFYTRALEVVNQMQQRGQLQPEDLWMIDELTNRIAALPK